MSSEIVEIPCEIEKVSESILKNQKGFTSFPISELGSLGTVGSEMLNFYNSYITPGGEGLYKVTFPKGVEGQLSKFKNENAFLGSIRNGGSFSQARLTQVSVNPQQLFMALVLMSVDSKLTAIMETQAKILNFMYDVQETKITAGIKRLNELISDYKYNWYLDNYVQQTLRRVGDEKKEASDAIELYQKQIDTILSNSPKDFHTIEAANKKIEELKRFLNIIHNAYYLYGYASFMECLLMGNFSEGNIQDFNSKISKYLLQYQDTYDNCHKWINEYTTRAIGSKVSPLLYGADKCFGKALNAVLPFNLGKVYENDSKSYAPLSEQIKGIESCKNLKLNDFQEEMKKICQFNKQNSQMYIDSKNVYLTASE